MGSRSTGAVLRHVRTLFGAGSLAGLGDDALIDRFVGGDRPSAEAAFAALVERHGPMVRRACLGVLGRSHEADADDAFQAVFVVLARRARSLRGRESIAPWLFGVACRVSRKARVAAARRRKHERVAADRLGVASSPEADGLDDWSALYEEIDHLPRAFRAPIVLCALEGRSAAEAAAVLGVAEGTVHSRLSRARARLRARLSRRGVTLAAWPLLAPARVAYGPPGPLIDATIRTAAALAAGRVAAGEVPAAVAKLVGSLSRRTLMNAGMSLGLVALALAPAAAGLGGGTSEQGRKPPVAEAGAAVESKPPADRPLAGESLHVRVVEEDGTPAAGVTVAVIGAGSREDYVADAEGRVVVPGGPLGMRMLVDRPGRPAGGGVSEGPGGRPRAIGFWQDYRRAGTSGSRDHPIPITLRPCSRAVTVRVVDESGRPIAGADVFVTVLMDVGPLGIGIRRLESRAILDREDSLDLFGPLTTGRDGAIRVALPDRSTATLSAEARLRAGPPVGVSAGAETPPPIVLGPGGGIGGIVTDSATGEPAAGIRVVALRMDAGADLASSHHHRAVTGADGRYLMPGARPGVYVVRPLGDPGAGRVARDVVGVRVEAGRDATADVRLAPARRLSGVVVSAVDGRPLAGVGVGFSEGQGAGHNWGGRHAETDASGRFNVPVLPGELRLLTILGGYRVVGDVRGFFVPEDRDPEPIRLVCEPRPAQEAPGTGAERPRLSYAMAVAATAIDVAEFLCTRVYWGEARGRRVIRGHVVDEQGEPLAGVRVWGLSGRDPSQVTGREDRIPVVIDGRSATTDRSGVFVLENQPEGEVPVALWRLPAGVRREVVAANADEVEFVFPIRR